MTDAGIVTLVDSDQHGEGLRLAIETSWRGARARSEQSVADRLRNAALSLFIEKGFDETTVSEIAERANVTSRTYFRYFPSKETVIIDIIDQTSTRLVALIAADRAGKSIPAVLEAAFVQWHEEYQDLFPLLTRLSDASRSLAAAYLLRQSDWEDHMVDALEARFPDTDPITLRLWGLIGYNLIRLAGEIATREGCSLPAAVPLAFGHLAEVAQAFPRRRAEKSS